MKKKLTTIAFLVITIVAAVFFAHTTKTWRIYDNNINNVSYTDIGVLADGSVLTQEFLCPANTLDGIMLKTGVAGDASAVSVTLELTDLTTGQTLASVTEPGTSFKPRKIHYFKLNRLEDQKGRPLKVTVTETGSVSGNGVTFCYANEAADSPVELDNSTLPGLLPLGTAIEGFDIETFIIFLICVWFIWGFMWFLYKLFQ